MIGAFIGGTIFGGMFFCFAFVIGMAAGRGNDDE